MPKTITHRQTDDEPRQGDYIVQREESLEEKAKREGFEKELRDSQLADG